VAYAHVEPDAGVVLGDGAAPHPFTLVLSENPVDLALDGTSVYWADFSTGEIAKVPKSGGSPVVLWSSPTTPPLAITVDATNVYFGVRDTGQSADEVMSVPIAGGTASTLASMGSVETGFLFAGPSQLYWIGPAIYSVPKAGGASMFLSTVGAFALALDASNLYFSGEDGIEALPLSGGRTTFFGFPPNPEPMWPRQPGGAPLPPTAIVSDGANLYYAVDGDVGVATVGYIPIAGGPGTVLATGRPSSVRAIAVDERNLYWIEGDGTMQQGAIATVPKTGGQVTVLVPAPSHAKRLAVDSSGLYFLPNASGGIGKIAK
jgi:hypothetical protein